MNQDATSLHSNYYDLNFSRSVSKQPTAPRSFLRVIEHEVQRAQEGLFVPVMSLRFTETGMAVEQNVRTDNRLATTMDQREHLCNLGLDISANVSSIIRPMTDSIWPFIGALYEHQKSDSCRMKRLPAYLAPPVPRLNHLLVPKLRIVELS